MGKSIDIDNRLLVVREKGEGEYSGHKVSLWGDENILEFDSSCWFINFWIHWKSPISESLKSWVLCCKLFLNKAIKF
jgi:hypothetical protein